MLERVDALLAGERARATESPMKRRMRSSAALAPGRNEAEGFYLSDAFDAELAAARAAYAQAQAEVDAARGREQNASRASSGAKRSPATSSS